MDKEGKNELLERVAKELEPYGEFGSAAEVVRSFKSKEPFFCEMTGWVIPSRQEQP